MVLRLPPQCLLDRLQQLLMSMRCHYRRSREHRRDCAGRCLVVAHRCHVLTHPVPLLLQVVGLGLHHLHQGTCPAICWPS
jgi:hypothetical protein